MMRHYEMIDVSAETTPKPDHEHVTKDPRFFEVTDRVPLVTSWGLSDILPRPGLVEDAVVQRAAQLYSPYYKTDIDGSYVGIGLDSLGIGLEDKLEKIPPEGMAKYFANEASLLKEGVMLKYPQREEDLYDLVEAGKIINGGSELGRDQLLTLAVLDEGIAAMVGGRLNRYPGRGGEGDKSFAFRQQIHTFIRTCGVPERRLIEYTDGKRLLALPRRDKLNPRLEPGSVSLKADLASLNEEELRDWKFLRSAISMLSDPRVREVLEGYQELKDYELGHRKEFEGLTSGQYRRKLEDAVKKIAAKRADVHRRN